MKKTMIAGVGLFLSLVASPGRAQIMGSPTDTGGAAKAGVGNVLTNHAQGIGTSTTLESIQDMSGDIQDSVHQAYQDYTDKKYAVATTELQVIEKKAPGLVEVHQMLADIYLRQNKIADSIPEMEAIVQLTPKDTATRSNLAVAYMQTSSYSKAAALYREELTHTPKDPKLYLQLGMALERNGQFTDAAAAFETASTLDPKDNNAPYYAGLLYHQSGNDAKAVPLLQKALALGGTEKFNTYTALAEAASTAKQNEEAIRNYTLAAQVNPDDYGTDANLGILNQNAGNKTEAEAAYRKALALKPIDQKSMASVQSNLALLLIGDGKLDEATTLLVEATSGDPTNARMQYNLGEVYEKQGKTELALTAYKKALAIDPAFTSAKESIARLKK